MQTPCRKIVHLNTPAKNIDLFTMRTSKNKKEVTSNVHSYCYAIILLTYVQLLTNLYKSSAAAEMDATAYLFMMNP